MCLTVIILTMGWVWFEIIMLLLVSIFLVFIFSYTISSVEIISFGFEIRIFRIFLFIIRIGIFFWSFLSIKIVSYAYILLIVLLIVFRLMFFALKRLFLIYVYFELSVLPIFLIIMGWGYQIERHSASLSLLFYTFTASLPLLLNLLLLVSFGFWDLLRLNMRLFRNIYLSPLGFLVLGAFFVKLPMWGVHIWLPKAHVEAPVIGSIILAAVLLKLGGFGLYIFIPISYRSFIIKILVRIRLVRIIYIRLSCLCLIDIKIIIAYSSVCHISFLIYSLLLGGELSVLGRQVIIIRHGFSSSSIFLFSYQLYMISKRRRIVINKRIMSYMVGINVVWFLILIGNMAAPPSLNFLGEVILIIEGLKFYSRIIIVFLVSGVATAAYTLLLYSFMRHGHSVEKAVKKVRLGFYLLIFGHIWGIYIRLIFLILN